MMLQGREPIIMGYHARPFSCPPFSCSQVNNSSGKTLPFSASDLLLGCYLDPFSVFVEGGTRHINAFHFVLHHNRSCHATHNFRTGPVGAI